MFFKLLRNKNFMNLWSTQIFTQLEVSIVDFTIALVIAKAAQSGISGDAGFGESATALVFALQFMPALPSALMAGVIADILDRRLLIVGINAFRAIFVTIFIFASHPGPHLYVFVFVMAVCMHMYEVIEKSTLRNVVSEDALPTANGLFVFTMNATTLVGIIAAGYLERLIGFQAILVSGLALFLFATFISYKLPRNINNFRYDHYVPDEPILADTGRAIKNLFVSLKESITYLVSIPPVWLSVIVATVVQTVMLVIAGVSFKFGEDILGIQPEQIYILLIPIAAGLAIGGAISPFFTKRHGFKKVIIFSWIIASILLTILGSIGFLETNLVPGLSFSFIFLMILIIVMGTFVTLIQAPALELIQKFADPTIRGRVFGILVGAANTISGLLVACSSFMVEAIGSVKFMVLTGIILLIGGLLYRQLLRKVLKDRDYTDYNFATNATQPTIVTTQTTTIETTSTPGQRIL